MIELEKNTCKFESELSFIGSVHFFIIGIIDTVDIDIASNLIIEVFFT